MAGLPQSLLGEKRKAVCAHGVNNRPVCFGCLYRPFGGYSKQDKIQTVQFHVQCQVNFSGWVIKTQFNL